MTVTYDVRMTADTRRTIRCADEVWLPAKAEAAERGESLSEVIRQALVKYAKGQTCGSDVDTYARLLTDALRRDGQAPTANAIKLLLRGRS